MCMKDEDGILLRDFELIRKRWVRWFHTLPNAKSSKLDPNIAEDLDDQWPTVKDLAGVIHSLANAKAVGPNGVSVELFKTTGLKSPSLVIPFCDGDCLTSTFVFEGEGGGVTAV